jgi:hypothetical protein
MLFIAGEEGWPDTAKSRVFFTGNPSGSSPNYLIHMSHTTTKYSLLWVGEGVGRGRGGTTMIYENNWSKKPRDIVLLNLTRVFPNLYCLFFPIFTVSFSQSHCLFLHSFSNIFLILSWALIGSADRGGWKSRLQPSITGKWDSGSINVGCNRQKP